MLHLTSCERIGKIGDPTNCKIADLRDELIRIDAKNEDWRDIIGVGFSPVEFETCIAALRIASEL